VRIYQRVIALPKFNVAHWTRPLAVTAMLAVLMVGSYRTVQRNPDWHDNIALALATAQGNPNSAKACAWAGAVLVSETKEQWTKDFGESLLQRTIELYPTMGSAYWDLTKYYFRENRVAEALIMMGKAARYHGGTLEMRRALKVVAQNLREHPTSTYLPAVEQLVAKEPSNAMAHFSYALALGAQGKNELAAKQFSLALDNDPLFGEADAELGLMKGRLGDFPGAVFLLRQYVLNSRYNGIARCDLAGALLELDPAQYPGAIGEAQMNLQRAQSLLPGDPEVRHLMLLMTHKKSAAAGKAAGQPVPSPVAVADHP
jgi:tetratricopeptide (TPR) repeat protein